MITPFTTELAPHISVSLTFWINGAKANAAGRAPVSLRITVAGKRAEVSCNLRCLPQEWDKTKNRLTSVRWDADRHTYLPVKPTNQTQALNAALDELESKARLLAAELRAGTSPLTAKALRARLLGLQPEVEAEPCALAALDKAALTYANQFTQSTARTALAALGRFLAPATSLPLPKLTPALCANFTEYITQHASKGTAERYSTTLRALFTRADLGLPNPFKVSRGKPEAVKPRHVLTLAELDALAQLELSGERERVARDIYLAQYYLHGSRVGVVLMLPWQQVDWKKKRVRYKAEKGGGWHNVELVPQLEKLLRPYWQPGAAGPIFPLLPANYTALPDAKKHRLRKAANVKVWHGLQVCAKLLGLSGQLHSHTARHSLATHTVQITRDYRLAQRMLGHSSVQMTENYIKDMLPEELDAGAALVYGRGAVEQAAPLPGGGKVVPLFRAA